MAPKKPQSYLAEAKTLEQSGEVKGAIKLYKTFLSRHRDHPNALKVRVRTAQLCVMQGEHEDAIKVINTAGIAGQQNLMMMYTLAQANAYAGNLAQAHEALEKTRAIDPDYPPAIARLATIMQYEGLTDDAIKIIDDAYARGIDAWDIDHTLGELAVKAGRVDEATERLQRRLEDQSIKGAPRVEMEYMLSTLLERQEKYQEAWDSATRANSLKTDGGMGGYAIKGAQRTKTNTSVHKYKARIERVMEIFTPELLRSLESTDAGPEARPEILMISGMPRSGTTLLEQILSAHPRAESAGEAPFLLQAGYDLKMSPDPKASIIERLSVKKRTKIGGQILEQLQQLSGSDEYVVDKHPGNDEHIGLLSAIAPQAKMILTRRDPRDVALSCYFRNFALGHGWTNSFESIVDMIEIRLQMHDFWLDTIPQNAPWLPLRVGDYQEIVNNPEEQTRSLVEFAGLEWDDACLNFSKRKRIVPTLQPHQAAQGVYKGSLAKWVRYADCMGGSLDRLNTICERHGYSVE